MGEKYTFTDISDLHGRASFGYLLNDMNLRDVAVEVGTHRGEFAKELLSTWGGNYLYCVDPYLHGYNHLDPVSYRDRDVDRIHCRNTLTPYLHRVVFMLMSSKEASEGMLSESVDFCYIDANHNYNNIKEDISLWYPKVRRGGILAGHDWDCPGEADYPWRHTVQRAVIEFCSSGGRDLRISLVSESDGTPWSWYIIKL